MDNLIDDREERDLDFLFKDGITNSYFKRFTDLLAKRIDDETIEKIKSNNITLLYSLSPGMVISNFIFPINEKQIRGHLVVIDYHIINYCEFSLEESAATILHELGHVLNIPDDKNQKEFYADSYAKQLGFGKYLSKSLSKFIEKDLPFVDEGTKKEIKRRIEALNDSAQVPLIGKNKALKNNGE